MIVGSPTQARDQLTELATSGGVTEIMVTTLVHDAADRRRSNRLLAEALELRPPA